MVRSEALRWWVTGGTSWKYIYLARMWSFRIVEDLLPRHCSRGQKPAEKMVARARLQEKRWKSVVLLGIGLDWM